MSRPSSSDSGVPRPTRAEVAAMRARLRDLQSARADLPPHSAQGWRADLDDQIDTLRRRIARASDDADPT